MSGMYWYAVAASDDVAGLKNKGFCITDDGEILYNEQYEYALARMYTSYGHGIVDVETSNFFFDKDASDRITINAEEPMTTPVLSYKLRMTDQYPDAEWFYFAANKSEEILEDGVPHPLYKTDGTLATKTDYADCEFEALNPMPSEFVGMYGRFTTATFSFATYQSTADVLHVEFTGLHQEEAEYCFADRLRVVVTASPMYGIPMGGMMSPTGHSTYYMQELPEQITVDNIMLSGFMIPTSSLEEYVGNDQLEPESIAINDNDVTIVLYDFDVPVTDQSKLYGAMRLNGTGSGSVPVNDNQTCWLNSDHSNKSYINGSQWNTLYDDNGAIVLGDQSNTYSIDGLYLNGNKLTSGYSFPALRVSDGKLQFQVLLQNSPYELTNIVVSVSGSQSFTDLDTLRQMGLVSLIYNDNHQLCLKFSCAGTGITFTGSMDSALIIAAIKQQMTVDNIGLQGMVGPMGGMMTEYVPLPTVSMSGDWGENNLVLLDSMGQAISLAAGASAYARRNGIISYDDTISYGVIEWQQTSTKSGAVEVSVISGNGLMMIKNVSSSSITITRARIAVCSSSSATVITVYDSSNNPYNAFKYTSDGTDYYYVLDGTQTDWTDDLSSIGYKLPIIGYVSSLKTEISMNAGDLQTLYDENGTKMTVSTYGISYPAVRVYSSSSDTTGTAVVNNNWTVHGPQFSSGDLSVSNLTGSKQTIQRIAFIK